MSTIKFKKIGKKLIFIYDINDSEGREDWVKKELKESGFVSFRRTFHFSKKDKFNYTPYLEKDDLNDPEYIKPSAFKLGKIENSYYRITKGVIVDNIDIYIHKDIDLELQMFSAEINISILKQISQVTNSDIYIGGAKKNAIPEDIYFKLLQEFPNSYEKRLYAQARIETIISEYFDNTNSIEKFNNYINKRVSKKGKDLIKRFKDSELNKYQAILDKLKSMLNSEDSYSEKQWQKEILQIVILLYPKYFQVFEEAPIRATVNAQGDIKNKFIDFLILDYNGNIDIIEIKKPMESSLVTSSLYRNNYIPLRELSGTIMQIEKYIYYLNRWGSKGEEYLTKNYQEDLPENFKIKITNPKGMIIMGREASLNEDQKSDFEVIKRKYKNVLDIISYDDLLKRLETTVHQLSKN